MMRRYDAARCAHTEELMSCDATPRYADADELLRATNIFCCLRACLRRCRRLRRDKSVIADADSRLMLLFTLMRGET